MSASSRAEESPDREVVLEKLLELSMRLGRSSELEEVLGVIIDALRDLLASDRATVFTHDSVARELVIHVAHGLGAAGAREVRIPDSAGIAGACASTRTFINIADAYEDPRFNQEIDRKTGYRTKSILAIPLIDHDGVLVGVAQVLNTRNGRFSAADERLAEGIASNAAVALRRAQLIRDHLAKVELERELSVAREIQESSFPRSIPHHLHYDIFGRSIPATECGGDAYDLFPLKNGRFAPPEEPCDSLAMLLADATGHGVGPALSSMQTRAMLRVCLRHGAHLSQVVEDISSQLSDDLPPARFVTAWLGQLNFATGSIECFSAGQGPIFIYRRSSDAFEDVDTDAPPFGIPVPGLFSEGTRKLQLHVGDILVLITDGYYEAMDPDRTLWGSDPVQAIIRASRDLPCSAILDALDRAVLIHAKAPGTDDDRTAILVKRLG